MPPHRSLSKVPGVNGNWAHLSPMNLCSVTTTSCSKTSLRIHSPSKSRLSLTGNTPTFIPSFSNVYFSSKSSQSRAPFEFHKLGQAYRLMRVHDLVRSHEVV